MTPEQQEAYWRKAFILMNLTRIGGTAIVLLALLLWQTDMIVEGGSIVGFPIAIAGLVISFFAPKYVARAWRTPPEP
jgi:hypothetical protein